MTELEALSDRLEKVERANRRMKLAGCLGALVVASLLVMGQARPSHKLEAQELVLRDAAGTLRAILSVSPEPHLTLYDAKERPLADMSAMAKGGFLSLQDASGARSIGLGATEEETVGLSILDKAHEIHAGIVVAGNDPIMRLSHGQARINLQILDGNAAINLFGRDGRMAIVHPAGLMLGDTNQKARLTLSSDIEEGPTVRLFDSQQNARVQLQAGKEGSSLRLRDSDGFQAIVGSMASEIQKTGEKRILKGRVKTGHAWSLQNRPYEMARDVILIYPAFS